MNHRSKWLLVPLFLISVSATAADRLAVLEFFGRYGCGYCSQGRQAMATLREEMQGQAVLLDYDIDKAIFAHGRQDRFWAATTAVYLPLAMIGSGFLTTSGPRDHEEVFRNMINAELARPATAAVTAFFRRSGSSVRAYVEVGNTGTENLRVNEEAAIWLIAYEHSDTEVTASRVLATEQSFLPFNLAPGESTSLIVETDPITSAYWTWMAALVLVENRPGGSGAYDMAQAIKALPADLYASPEHLIVAIDARTAQLELNGPHVLSWSATSDVPWIEVSPSSGTLPATPTIEVKPELRPKSQNEGSITFSSSGDGMAFSTTVTLNVGAGHRRPGRRVRPAE